MRRTRGPQLEVGGVACQVLARPACMMEASPEEVSPMLNAEHVSHEARAALSHFDTLFHALTSLDVPEVHDSRTRIVYTLSLASIDFGRSCARLMTDGFPFFVIPAAALHRAQMEHALRAAFFSGPATEAEIVRFKQNKDILRRAPAGRTGRHQDKQKKMSARDMAAIVEPLLVSLEILKTGHPVLGVVSATYGPLSVLLHGGIGLVNSYTHSDGELGPDIAPDAACEIIGHCAAFGIFALVAAIQVAKNSADEISKILEGPMASIDGFNARLTARSAATKAP